MDPVNHLIIKASALTYPDLKKLVDGEVMAISIENFTSVDVCKAIADKILQRGYDYYDYAQNVVGRFGMSFSEAVNPEKTDEYYEKSVPTSSQIRSIFAPYQSPIDHLRLRLEEICPAGAKLEQIEENKTMFVGLCRVIDPNKIVLPHQDDIRWDHGDLEHVANLISQLAVNIYLKVPETGGALELWDYGCKTKEEYTEMADGSYGISKVKLLEPVLQLTPKVGELIIFNPRNLHCILPGSESRMSQSCFLGYRGDNKPVTYWS